MIRKAAVLALFISIVLIALLWRPGGVHAEDAQKGVLPTASVATGASTPLTGSASAATTPPLPSIADILEVAGDLSDPAARQRAEAAIRQLETDRRAAGRARAAELGLPTRVELPDGRVKEVAGVDESGRPVYFITHNTNAAISVAANVVQVAPYSLRGEGMVIGMWDGGSGRASHQEFGSRLVVKDGSASIDHATHVGGTMAAAGVVASARGMAPVATIDSYDWNSDKSEMTARGAAAPNEAGKIYLSNHSYGYLSGWHRTGGSSPAFIWYGSGTTATSIDPRFGQYNTYARDSDALAASAPYYLMFRSAGNERTDNPANGQLVQLSTTDSTTVSYDAAVHPGGDGTYRGGFDTLSFDSVAKNVITIGSTADALTSGVRDPAKALVSSFSSWGPTDDGRIKPDLVANGDSLYSPLNGSNTSYGNLSGTSMATPNATGAAALLVQEYARLFAGGAMRSSTLKGLLIHTADDRGNAGPDYKYGWGLMNTKAAVDLLRDHAANPLKIRLTEAQVTSSVVTVSHDFVWDGVSPIRATLTWTDPAGAATTSTDLRTARLRNNLDLKLVDPNGTEHLPYVMPFVGTWTQESMNLPATTGVNNTDNVEQVYLAAPPAAGVYRAIVSFQGTLANNQQFYSLLVSGSANEVPPPPPLTLAAVSPASGIVGNLVTLDLTGTSLATATSVTLLKSGQNSIVATNLTMVGEALRCQVNLTGAAAGAWSVRVASAAEAAMLTDAFTVIGAVWSENFDGTVTGWTSQALTGANTWSLASDRYHSAARSYFAPAPSAKTTVALQSPAFTIPANASNLQLKFWHWFSLQSAQDGGRLEISLNGGAWFGAGDPGSGTAFASNGYNSTISSSGSPSNRSEFAGKPAWSGSSNGFIETILNLTDTANFAGQSVRFRWVLATNNGTASTGWYVDSIVLLGGGDITNQPPTITTAATTNTGETTTDLDGTVFHIVRDTSVGASVSASDDGGEAALTYHWSASNVSGDPVFFTSSGTNAAKQTTAQFEAIGDYVLTVTVKDASGLAASSAVNVRVVGTLDGVIVTPAAASVTVGATQQFSALALDQFGDALAAQPSSFTWGASGGGSITTAGLYSATQAGGPFAITATSGDFVGVAGVTVAKASATISLSALEQVYNGTLRPVSVITTPAGLAVSVTYDGSTTAPTNAGSYAVEANITDPNYQGGASGTLTISRAAQTITFAALAPRTLDEISFELDASTSSGLPLSFASGDSQIASVSGNTVTLLRAGIVAITACQTGDANYLAAAQVEQLLTIHPRVFALSLSASPDEGGSVSGAGSFYDGTLVPIEAVPNEGWQFSGWSGAAVGDPSSAQTTVLIAADTQLVANFERVATPTEIVTQWGESFGLEGDDALPGADPDHDGTINLLEFVLGGSPVASDSHLFQPELTIEGDYCVFTFERHARSAEITVLTVQATSDLVTWADVATIDSAQTGRQAVRVPRPGTAALFVRLRVTLAP